MKGKTNAVAGGSAVSIGDTVALITNQDNHSNLLGVKFTVTYGSNTKEYAYQGEPVLIDVPNDEEYTVVFPEIEGYSIPEPFTGTKIQGYSRSIIGEYKTCLVTVNVTSTGDMPVGYTLNIGPNNSIDIEDYVALEYIENVDEFGYIKVLKLDCYTDLYSEIVCTYAPLAIPSGSTNHIPFSSGIASISYNYSNVNTINTSFSGVSRSLSIAGKEGDIFEVTLNKSKSAVRNLTTGNTYSQTSTASTRNTNNYFTIGGTWSFSAGSTGTGTNASRVKFYSAQIKNNNELVYDFVPVIKISTNEVGIYNKVNNEFTAFTDITAGPAIVNKKYTQTTASATYKLPYKKIHAISASSVYGFWDIKNIWFNTDSKNLTLDIVYQPKILGVSIYDTDGLFTSVENWNTANNSKAVGVALMTDNVAFVIAKNNIGRTPYGGGFYLYKIQAESNINTAKTLYDGVKYTNEIVEKASPTEDWYDETVQGGRKGSIAKDCADYTFPNGQKGYLGSSGEWNLVLENQDAIDSALTRIGGTKLSISSSQYGDYYATSVIAWANHSDSVEAWGPDDDYVSVEYEYDLVWSARVTPSKNSYRSLQQATVSQVTDAYYDEYAWEEYGELEWVFEYSHYVFYIRPFMQIKK